MIYIILLIIALLVGFCVGKFLKKSEKTINFVNNATKLVVISLIIVVGSKFGVSGVFKEGAEILIRSGLIALLSSAIAVLLAIMLLNVFTKRGSAL